MTDANPFDALSQKGEQQPTATPEPNPFDAFGVPEPALTQPPRPTPEQFAENAYEKGRGGQGGVFTHAAEVYQQKREERIVSRADTEGVAQPGDVFSSKPTQSEVDLAIANLAARKAEYDKLYSFPEPQTWDEKLGSVSGSLNAGLTAPENLLPISRVGKAIQVAGETRGLGEVASNIMGRAAEVGVFSGSLDLAEQGLDIAAGHQKSIDEARLLWSTALGAGFGGSMPAMAALAKSYKGHFPTQINYWETQPISARQSEFISQEGKSAGVTPGKAASETPPIPDNDASIDATLGPTISDGGEVSVRPPAAAPTLPPGINPPRPSDVTVGDILGRPETKPVPGSATEAPTEGATSQATTVAGSAKKPPGESPIGSEPAPPAQPKTSIEDVKLAAEDYRQSLIAAITEAADKASGINKGTKYKAYTTGFEAGLRDGVEPKSAAGKAGFAAGKSYLATEEGKALLEKRNKANDLEINYKKDIGEWYDQTQLSDFKTWFSTSKVVDKSGKPAIYYHATKGSNDFDVFKAKQANSIFASSSPKFTTYFHGKTSGDKGSIYPVYIRALNPFDYADKSQVDALVSALKETAKYKFYSDQSLRNKITGKGESGNWQFLEDSVVQDVIKQLDHDGYYIFETLLGIKAKNIAVYEPTQLKSAIGNKGTFNPKDPRITHFKIGDDVESLKLGNEIVPTNADTLEAKFPKKGIAGDVNDVRISNRGMMPRELAPEYGGVSAKEELNHRLNESMREIATSLGLKFGIYDRNYNIRTALGTYNTRVGEIHIRYFGDLPVFIHELGHAMDYWMKGDSRTRDAWGAFIKKNFNELVWLDLNWQIGGMKGNPSIAEGVAEFMRAFVTNPAFAQNKAPNAFADLMSVISLAPEVESALARVQSLAHIESKLEPTQVFTTMVAEHPGFSTGFGKRVGGGLKPGDLKPSAIMKNLRKNGVVTTFTDYVHAIYTSVVGSDHAFSRYMDAINDALFYATGKPLELTFSQDPYVRYRMLPGAEQESSAAVMYGWKPYGASSGQPMSPSLQGALQKAFNGSLSRLENEGDPIVRAFNGYLIARRAITEWKRWEAGELLSQPVRASKNETIRAIADFEAAYPQFRDAANDIFAFRRAQFNRSVDAGIVSYELAEKILSNEIDHVPFWRDFTDEHAGSGGGGSSANLEYSPIRQFHGSTRDILNPIMSIIEDASMHSRTIAINDVYRAIDRMVKRLGDAGAAFWVRRPNSVIRANSIDIEEAITNLARVRGVSEDDAAEIIRNLQGMLGEDLSAKIFRPEEIKADGKKVLFFFEAGKRVAVEVGDTKISKDFFDLMSNTSKSQFDFLLNTAEILNGLFQSSIVHAPRFMIGTMVRDNMTRSFIPRYMGMLGRVPPVQDITGLYTLLFNRSFADALASGGLIKGGVVSHAVRDFSSGDLTHAMKGMTAKNWREAPRAFLWNTTLDRLNAADGNPLKIAKALTFDTVWGAVKSGIGLIESGETISRVGVARLTYKYLKKQGLTDEEALRGAIFEANDMLDYSRKGSATNSATKLVPFLNPGIQGVDRSLRSSVAEPLRAIAKMRDRGGYANLDAKDKNAITAWAKNLMMFSLYAGAYLTYKQTIKDEPFYQQASPQRKKDYMLFPLGEDKYGTPVGVTLRKPLDWPGAVLNMMEDFIDELEESDPINWDKISHSLKEGIIPRQFQSFDALLSASPIPKTAYEVALNTKFGAPGTSPQPIVPPEIAEKGSPAEQFSNYTSDIAKFIGRELNVSPMVVDHVIRSAGTSAQDITDLSTAVVGDNPIVTPSEALSRFFFGAIYRQQRGAPAYRADMQDLVAKDHGTYQIQANAYLSALKDGDEFKAEQVYNRADDGAKTFMLIQSSSNFSSEIQQLHPLEHSQAVARVMHGLMSRLPEKLVEIHSERYEKGAAHKVIKIDRDQAKLLDTQFNMIVAEETRNGLAIMKQPGYDSFEVKDTTPRLEIIRHISPEVADEVEAVLAKAHILPATAIKAVWPEVKDRLLKDKSNAYLGDLQLKAKFGAELMPRMLVQ